MRMTTGYTTCLLLLLMGVCLSYAVAATDDHDSVLLFCGFEDGPAGTLTARDDPSGHWESLAGSVRVQVGNRRTGNRSLRMEGDRSVIVWTPAATDHEPYELSFWAERWSGQGPFGFTVEAFDGESWHEVYRGDETIRVGGFNTQVTVPLNGVMPKQLRLTCISEPGKGVLIDDLRITRFLPMSVRSVTVEPTGMPVLIGNRHNPVSRIVIDSPGSAEPLSLEGVTLSFKSTERFEGIQAVEVYCTGAQPMLSWRDPGSAFDAATPVGEPQTPATTMTFSGDIPLSDGRNYLWISYRLLPGADRLRVSTPACESLTISGQDYYADGYTSEQSETLQPQRIGGRACNPGDDGVTSTASPV
ncbi:MAG: BNR-repeat neuraminidase N-terminal domain-containing protein [Phycisphaerales bacterium]